MEVAKKRGRPSNSDRALMDIENDLLKINARIRDSSNAKERLSLWKLRSILQDWADVLSG